MNRSMRSTGCVLHGVALFLLTDRGAADDWPQYRGPHHDGVSAELIRTNWSAEPPATVWKVPLDPALSSMTVAGNQVFTMVRRTSGTERREFCIALDAATGAERWASVPLGRAAYPDGGVGLDDGPRSTPSTDGSRVYVLTSYLALFCLDASNGTVIWSKDLVSAYGAEHIPWQNTASPLLADDLVILNANGCAGERLIAFRKLDGSEAWKGQSDALTHASPVRATIGGIDQAIFLTQSGLVGLELTDGSVLWRQTFAYNEVSAAASPVVGGDIVYWSAAYGTGAGATRITGTGSGLTASELWRRPGALQNHWSTPVHFNGQVYGLYGQSLITLKCVELATGVEKWSRSGFGTGSVLAVGGNILVLSDSGELVLVAPNPETYIEIARFRAVTGKCWNNAAISNGRIYFRSTTEAVCLDVTLPAPPPLQLSAVMVNDEGLFRLLITNQDGSPIAADRVPRLGVLAADELGGATSWNRLPESPVLSDGQLHFDDPAGASRSARFYRVEEQP